MTEKENTASRYSDADLAEFRTGVESKLAKAKDELSYMQEQILEITENSGDDHGGDWMDDSSTNNDIEFLNNMAIRQRKYIQDLENALIRIKNKTYGMCSVTGQLIDKRRLLAVPTATKSVEAKNAEVQRDAKKDPERRIVAQRDLLDDPDREEKKEKAPATPKIITKVIRKPKNPSAKPAKVEDDDDFEFDDLDKDYNKFDDSDDSDDADYGKGGTVEQPDMFDDGGGGGDDGGGNDDY